MLCIDSIVSRISELVVRCKLQNWTDINDRLYARPPRRFSDEQCGVVFFSHSSRDCSLAKSALAAVFAVVAVLFNMTTTRWALLQLGARKRKLPAKKLKRSTRP
uniref:Transposase n=1 Tax=Steinernema glaseri TaxID=37863 RepID=A0A1I7YKA1_9BILA